MQFNLLAEAQKDGFREIRHSTSKGGQYNGPCILGCKGGGTDRLRIQPHQGEYGWFICEHCNSKGSGIDWLMIKRGMSKHEALQAVGWKPKDGSEPHYTIPASAFQKQLTHDAPCQDWQISARAFVAYCETALWSDQGQAALDYLHGRGLKDETIRAARLGYNPVEFIRSGEKWGRKKLVKLAKGIIIPWFYLGDIWRLTIRDESVASGNGRYTQVEGGSNGLYLADFLHYDRPVIVVEGEFDALSIAQECGKHVIAVATGTTQGSHTTRWVTELARKDHVFIAFDAEKDKGDTAANWWLERLEHAQRLRPWWKDANQMLQDGVNLWEDWLQPSVSPSAQPETEQTHPEEELELELDPALCSSCWDKRRVETPATVCVGETWYCDEHYQQLQATHPAMTAERFVELARERLPDDWQITIDPPGYTLADRVAELQAERHQPLTQEDYWTATRRKLAAAGYHERYVADNAV